MPVRKVREHCVFVRPWNRDEFVYAGSAHLGSYGGPEDSRPGNREACFTLDEHLPRDIWLACGGYRGWSVMLNHAVQVVEDGDSVAFDGLLERLTAQEYSHLCMTRYEEDSLTIHTNSNLAWLMYLREPWDGGLYLHDPSFGDREVHFQCVCGISMEFPASQTVSQLPGNTRWA
jgi:hypothetical protein